MALDYSKWDKTYKVSAEEVKELDANGGKREFEKLPYGKYEVKVAKMELGSSKNGDPMMIVRFKVLEGKNKDKIIYMNQLVDMDFRIHNANEFMRSLDSGEEIVWTGKYSDYATLIDKVFEAIDGNLEYVLDYSCNSRGFGEFKIEEVFEVE